MTAAILDRLDGKREEIVALTQELVRVPTVNPPGDAYGPCAELVGERLRRRGFEVRYLRAEGTPGDSDRLPRLNVVARREGARPGPCVHFNGHIDVVPAGQGWTVDPWCGEVRDGKVFGRGACDMKGGLAAAIVAVETLVESGLRPAGRAGDLGHGRRGVGRLRRRRLPRGAGPVLPPARRPRDHPRAAQRRPGVHRPPRRLVGRDRDVRPDRPRLDAVPGRLRGAPHGGRSRCVRARAVAPPGAAPHGHAGGPARGARLDAEPQRASTAASRKVTRACPARACRTAAG